MEIIQLLYVIKCLSIFAEMSAILDSNMMGKKMLTHEKACYIVKHIIASHSNVTITVKPHEAINSILKLSYYKATHFKICFQTFLLISTRK